MENAQRFIAAAVRRRAEICAAAAALTLPVVACSSHQAQRAPEYATGTLSTSSVPGTGFGFSLVVDKEIPQINGTAKVFTHAQSGARVLKLETDDNSRLFAIFVRTPPQDDTGLSHILEHAVLKGSEKYPIRKGPPHELAKGGTLSFWNGATTRRDVTSFFVESSNPKDFYNLIDIYLDAVFSPKIYEEEAIFLQQRGHFIVGRDKPTLGFEGIVYNEMKGRYSPPWVQVSHHTHRHLFPDNNYRFFSGGLPSAMPALTYRDFLAYHKRLYYPANSLIFLYGSGDTAEELEFLGRQVLSRFDYRDPQPPVPRQKPFSAPKEIQIEYPVATAGKTQNKTLLNLAFVVEGEDFLRSSFTFEILQEVLCNSPTAPLKKAVVESGIATNIEATYTKRRQGVFEISASDANPDDGEAFRTTVMDTLAGLVRTGFDRDLVAAAVNRVEFARRQAQRSGIPKGFAFLHEVRRSWVHSDDPLFSLDYHDTLEGLKARLGSGYLERAVETHLLKNPHRLLVTAIPKPGLGETLAQKERQGFESLRSSLPDADLQRLIQKKKNLDDYLATPNSSEALKKLPRLTLADIDPRVETTAIQHQQLAGADLLVHHAFTNDIVYLNFFFDARTIPQELLPYLPLFSFAMGKLRSRNSPYTKINNQLGALSGDVEFGLTTFADRENDQAYFPKLSLRVQALASNLAPLLEVLADVTLFTQFDDHQRLRQVLSTFNSELQQKAKRNGYEIAYLRLASSGSDLGQYRDQTEGLGAVQSTAELAQKIESEPGKIADSLSRIASLILNRKGLVVGITAQQRDQAAIEKALSTFLARLPNRNAERPAYAFLPRRKKEGLASATAVNFVAQGGNARALGEPFSGKLWVLHQILRTGFLREEIRSKGGAYDVAGGVGTDGTFSFISYYDPHIVRTLETYQKVPAYLRSFDASPAEMERFIIGTIAFWDLPLLPNEKGEKAFERYFSGISAEDHQRLKTEILSTTAEDIRGLADLVEAMLNEDRYCVYGNGAQLQQHKDLFSGIVPVSE